MSSPSLTIQRFVVAAFFFVGLVLASPHAQAEDAAKFPSKPNFLIFLADDLGSADVPWRGGNYSMPVLDALAKEMLGWNRTMFIRCAAPRVRRF